MKKKFLSPLIILFITILGLVSCNNNIQTKTQVTLTIPVNELYNQISARDAQDDHLFSDSEVLVLEVKLFVNGKEFSKNSITFDSSKESQTIEFNQVPINSTVYAEAWIKSTITIDGNTKTADRLYGKSDTQVVSKAGIELSLKLQWLESAKTTEPDANVFLNFYIQKKDTNGYPIEDSYELYKTIPVYTKNSFTQPGFNMFEEADIVAGFTWTMTELSYKGYKERSELDSRYDDEDEDITFVDGKLYINYYYNVDPHPDPIERFYGSAGGQTYILYITDGNYIICDHNDNSIGLGMFSFASDTGDAEFIQVFYKKDEKILFPSYFYENGTFLGTEIIPQLNYWSESTISSSTTSFALAYYSDTDPIIMTFNIPEGTNAFELFKRLEYGGNNNSDSIDGQIFIQGEPQFSIEQIETNSEIYLNVGELVFEVTKLNENVTLTDLSAKLYYQGSEVSNTEYRLQKPQSNILKINPKALGGGGEYIAKVIVKGNVNGADFEASSDYRFQVTAKTVATLDVSEDSFLSDMIDILSTASGPVSLTLIGERDTADTDYYSPEYSLYQNIGYILQQYNANPVDLDMSAVTGTSVNVFESELLTRVCNSVKLAPDLKAIRYVDNTPVNIITEDSDLINDTWYLVKVDNSWDGSDEYNLVYQILAGKTQLSQVYDDIYNAFEISTFTWSDIENMLSGNLPTSYLFTYCLIRGED